MVQINFKGKQFVQNHHLAVKYHQLVSDKKASLTDKISLHDNLIIHGDNLAALKALLPTYAGKVKCVYIDPPYNTGNEGWVYNDNVNSPMMQDWLGKVVDKDDLTRHDKWLCMMWPRLRLLRELMADDGSIWISIDDNEVHHLRDAMDEIFGEDNFIANVVWQHSVQPKGYGGIFSVHHNHLLCYAKSSQFTLGDLERTEEHNKNYSNSDNDPKGAWRSGDVRNALYRPNLIYKVKTPSGKTILPPEKGWRWSYDTMMQKIASGEIIFNQDETRIIRKIYLENQEGRTPETIWFGKDVGTTRDAAQELKQLFDGNVPLETAKPVKLIKRILDIATSSDSIILDSFAGSGTTANAVLALNKEDGGNRKFILVEYEEYANTLTAERMRRVIRGVKDTQGLDGTFSYFKLGDPIEMESLLAGEKLPSYQELARYVFFTATGEQLDESKIDEKRFFVGNSQNYEVFMFYNPDVEFLKSTALTLERAKALGKVGTKKRLVFAPTKYLDQEYLDQYRIDFCQLPFEIYRLAR